MQQESSYSNVQSAAPLSTLELRREVYMKKYEDFFRDQKMLSEEQLFQIHKLLTNTNMKFLQKEVHPQLKVEIVSHTINFKIIILRLQLNKFEFNVSILNQEVNSRAHLLEKKKYKYADLYTTTMEKQDFAVKCFRIDPEQDVIKQFNQVLRQYAYYKIAAALQIGPPLVTPFGFDIQITDECIQFAMLKLESMQKSKEVFHGKNNNPQKSEKELKEKLFRLHSLNITHNNIHPFNLLYNKKNQQFYLSDFCFCKYVPEPQGQTTPAFFSGGLNYSSQQMLEVFDGRSKEADLYFNDCNCLQETFNYVRQTWALQKKCKEQGRRCRIQQMRDVYDDYGSLYINLGSYYQKIDSVYQYLFSYYDLLKVYLAMHYEDSSIFKANQHVVAIKKYPERILEMIKEYSSDLKFYQELKEMVNKLIKTEQQIKAETQKAILLPKMEDINLIRNLVRQEIKKKRLSLCNQLQSTEVSKELLEKLALCFYDEKHPYVHQVLLQRKVIVHNPVVISKLDRNVFYQQFIKFIEIRQIRSTYDEKVKACECFIKGLKLQAPKINIITEHPELSRCLKYMLDQLLQRPCSSYQTMIPDILTNLIISDTISDIDLYATLDRLCLLKGDPLNNAIMLFNVYCGLDWIKFKSVNMFEYKKIFEISRKNIYETLKAILASDVNNQALKQVIKIIVPVIASDSKAIQITPVFRKQLLNRITKLVTFKAVDLLTANRMASLICVNSAIDERYRYSYQSITEALNCLYQFNPKLGYDKRIESYHLRVYAMLERIKTEDVQLLSIKTRFWQTFQVPKLLNKYKLFFSEERKRYSTDEIPRMVKILENLSAIEKYKFCHDVILEWKYWLSWLSNNIEEQEDKEFYKHYTDQLKKIYTTDALYNMNFPPITQDNDFLTFYESTYELLTFYFIIYKDREREVTNIAENFLDQLQNHYDALNFAGSPEIKEIVVHFLNFIKLESYYLGRKKKDAILLYKEGIKQLKNCKTMSKESIKVFQMQYVESILKWAFIHKTQKNKNRYFEIVFSTLHNEQLISNLFSHQKAYKFILFVMWYSLIEIKRRDVFFFIHQQLLNFLGSNPNEKNIALYSQSLKDFFEEHPKEIKSHCESIVRTLITKKIQINSIDPALSDMKVVSLGKYYCIMLAYLFKFQEATSPDIQSMCRCIVSKADSLAFQARAIILDKMLSFKFIDSLTPETKLTKKQMRRMRHEVRRNTKYITLNKEKMELLLKKQNQLKMFKKKGKSSNEERLRKKKALWDENVTVQNEDQDFSSDEGSESEPE